VIINALIKKGIVPYDQMGAISATLLENPRIRESICKRLQFLFVDEFQDVDTTQLRVFESIRQEGRTVMFAVGDPEQYISSFTYGQRSISSPKYLKIPFFRFSEKANRSEWSENHRSCSEIVNFTNNFHSHLTQQSSSGSRGSPRVFILPETTMPEIVERFRTISDKEYCGQQAITRLYLGFANTTYDEVREQYGLVSVSHSSVSHRSALSETLDVITKLLCMSQTRIRDLWGLNLLEWRKLGISILRQLRSGEISSQEQVEKMVDAALPGQVERKYTTTSEIAALLEIIRSDSDRYENERCSSIHRAKGLEADAVLVVARTPSELCKWIQTDGLRRADDTTDSCRIGFVAFSRAKEVLCIACKKVIPDETKKLLSELGAMVIAEMSPREQK
jgi:DNA helicase-2/ATP-dependent DNA helicase PcrA